MPVAEKINCPVLFLFGAEDPQFSTIPEAGHLPSFETPAAFNPALENFLAERARSNS